MTPRTARIALGAVLLCIYGTLSVARTISNALRDAGLLRAAVATAFVLAGVAVVLFVARTPALRNPRTRVATLAVALVYAAVIFPMSSPEEKLHFLEYGAVGVLAFFSTPPTWLTPRRFGFAVLFTLAAGWLDEGIQALLPSRHYDLRDVGFNALAGTMALIAFGLIRWTARPVSSGAVMLLCVGLATPANAVIQRVYDVPGLTLKAEVIVVAVRQGSGSFKVRQSLRGGLVAGAELTVSTLGYAVTWNAAEPEVMLFLERGGAGGMQLVLVDSGLRQRGFRFEQRRNPGSYEAIEDSREVQSTLTKVAVLEALADETDLAPRRKIATALVPFEVQPEAHAFTFNDELATRAKQALAARFLIETDVRVLWTLVQGNNAGKGKRAKSPQVTAERPKRAAGKYALTLEEYPGGEAVHWPMGMLVVTSDGKWLLE